MTLLSTLARRLIGLCAPELKLLVQKWRSAAAWLLTRYNAEVLNDIFYQNAVALVGEDEVARSTQAVVLVTWRRERLDAYHPSFRRRYRGRGHASDYAIADPELAYIVPTKLMAMSLVDLLADGAAGVAGCQADFEPVYTKESYLQMWEELLNS